MTIGVQDFRVTTRGLRRSPMLAVTAILVLALGIGMADAMLSVVDATLLRRLPIRDQDHVAVLWTWNDPTVELSIDRTALDRTRTLVSTSWPASSTTARPSTRGPMATG